MVIGVNESSALIKNSSPNRLGSGGRPRLAAAVSSHQNVERGRRSFSPRLSVSVRVPVRS